jgi:membrane protein
MTINGKSLSDFIKHDIWGVDISSLGRSRSLLVKLVRLALVAAREFTEGQLTLRAMSLVYTTLLSIVPLLAISFSILKGFGVHNQVVEPFMLKFLAPLGDKGAEITSHIIGFVENMKVGVLGSVGIALLFYTVISVIQKVEKSFNSIWRIKRSRTFARRFSDYISILLVGPVLLFSAIGLTASVKSNTLVQKIISVEPFGTIFFFAINFSPYVIVCAAFTFFYIFIPNTKVKFKAALTGGITAGVLWEISGWAFATFTVTSTKYAAIYSGFAILIMFMIWLYLNWLILLVGAQISFLYQHPELLGLRDRRLSLSNSLKERLSLLITFIVCDNYYHGRERITLHALVNRLRLPSDTIEEATTLLEESGILLETNDEPSAYIPAKDIEMITLAEVFASVRDSKSEMLPVEHSVASIDEVNDVIDSLQNSISASFSSKTMKDLVLSSVKD